MSRTQQLSKPFKAPSLKGQQVNAAPHTTRWCCAVASAFTAWLCLSEVNSLHPKADRYHNIQSIAVDEPDLKSNCFRLFVV